LDAALETNMSVQSFHPVIAEWFSRRFATPTEPQSLGWPSIREGRDTLIAAPTGSGKTLTAFLASLDRLLRLALAGELRDQTYVVYVSPLRALSNDIQRNLQGPLAEILEIARRDHPDCPDIRALVRTGDTPAKERQRMVRRPPHILVTTPESLYLVLTGAKSREILRHVETVIVDEIHAVARDRRGSHLALSLERLDALCKQRPVRVGLSATQKPIDELGRFLVGSAAPPPAIVDVGHLRTLDIQVEVPRMELQAVCTHEHWAEIYDRLVELVNEHRSTLIFVNTRKFAERVAHQLTERLGPDQVLAHHGSLAHRSRQRTEQLLKEGRLKAVVATASLELGIDIGHIDLVCQIGSPRSIATFLQRIGRAGHALGLVPKGRLFALSRDELIEALALVRAVSDRRLDRVPIPVAPLDILAQQIVAAVACDDWDEDELFERVRRAYPYRNLSRDDYEAVLDMVGEGIAPERGRFGAYVQRDRVNRRLHARKGARLTAITCGGAIPEITNYKVVLEDESRTVVGTVDEDFAVESNGGDVFLLGNTSWRVKHVRNGEVVVSNAPGAPATIPFWLGEAPGRTVELSAEVGRLREELAARIGPDSRPNEEVVDWLMQTGHIGRAGAEQAIAYVAAQHAATGLVPTQKKVLFERFFDESGGMHLVIHAPFGSRINKAWGLALRKRFCRTFDFELQASADDNGVVLSFGDRHSFPLDQMFHLVPPAVARDVLVQAFLAAPFFGTRWRWNVTRALQLKRLRNGQRVPPHLQRMRAEDLLTSVFPAQTACQENVVGDIPIPDQPIVRQTVDDCLNEVTDFDGCLQVLRDIESGAIETIGLDSREPSPFSHQLLNANPYAFLDDAPLEERRARAVTLRRSLSPDALRDIGRLDPEAIAQVKEEAWPVVRDADELHDALLCLGAMPTALRGHGSAPKPTQSRGHGTQQGTTSWTDFFNQLHSTGRATSVERPGAADLWVATERWPMIRAIWPDAQCRPEVSVPRGVRTDWPREEAIAQLVRGRMECVGPTTVSAVASDLGLSPADVEIGLVGLEAQGSVLRGRFTGKHDLEWCDRRLLARIHRRTLEGLRRQIAAVSVEQFMRFLVRYQHLQPETKLRGQSGLLRLVEQLEGFEAPAGHWEKFLLPARLESYDPTWLDTLTFMGQAAWGRLRPIARAADVNGRPMKALTRSTPITLMQREHAVWLLPSPEQLPESSVHDQLGSNARAAHEAFVRHGALFPAQIGQLLLLMPSQVEDVLGELAAAGLVTSDGYPALRTILGVRAGATRRSMRRPSTQVLPAGRWTLLRSPLLPQVEDEKRIENWCRLLLRRYGVVFRELLANESAAPRWGELVRVYRRMEARGEIRYGRFIDGVAGEQFALSETIPLLRAGGEVDSGSLELPATDPTNLTGRIMAGARVPALPGHSIAIVNGALKLQNV
jgi:ATP-dependent helicase Lhr and Lhr-like helicase